MVAHNMDFSAKVAEIELVYRSKVKASDRPKVNSSLDAYELLHETWDMDKLELQEQFRVILLDRGNKVLGISTIASGGVSDCLVDLKLVFAAAIKAKSSAIILSHNHPSGNLTFSDADMRLTQKFATAGNMIDVKVLDHVLVTAEGYKSLADCGRMPAPF